jgi:hypothetical protein
VTIHAAFAKELAWLQNPDHGFLALLGQDSKLDLAFLNVKNRVRDIALPENVLIPVKVPFFPRPRTLARKLLGSNMSLAGFSTGASFGSTNVIQL